MEGLRKVLLMISCCFAIASSASSTNYYARHAIQLNVDGDSRNVVFDDDDKGQRSNGDSSLLSTLGDVGEDLGVEQDIQRDPSQLNAILESLRSARQYLTSFNFSASRSYRRLEEDCRNKNELCSLWTVLGECQRNPGYMNVTCAPMCHSCEYLLPEVRCPVDPNALDAWYPGDLNKMFERLSTHANFSQYHPTILSSPLSSATPGNDMLASTTKLHGAPNASTGGPWILRLDNVLTTEQANQWVEFGNELGFRSSRQANRREVYTSDSIYCTGKCDEDLVATSPLMVLVEEWTGIPRANYENVNLLRYKPGQSSSLHSDYIFGQRENQEGVRMLSVLFYLNDVEQGGETNFEHANNVTVTPKLGSVIIWPNVLNDDPNHPDDRTDHQAFPVIKGIKYAAYLSIHQRDFKASMARHCTLDEKSLTYLTKKGLYRMTDEIK